MILVFSRSGPDDVSSALFYDTFTIDENHVRILWICYNTTPECSIDSRDAANTKDPFSPEFMEQLSVAFSV